MKEKVLFDHFPKCGGTSVNAYLSAAAGKLPPFLSGVPGFFALDWFSQYDIVAGHFGGRVLFPELGVRTLTVIREPYERLTSNFFHHKRGKRDDATSLESLLDPKSSLGTQLLNNPITRHFAAANGETVSEEALVERAKSNINQYELVGITEDLGGFFKRCSARFGWPLPESEIHRRRSANRVPVEPPLEEKFKERLALDYETYRYAKARLAGETLPDTNRAIAESANSDLEVEFHSLNGETERFVGLEALKPLQLKFWIRSKNASGQISARITLRYSASIDLGHVQINRLPALKPNQSIPIVAELHPPLLAGLYSLDITIRGITDKRLFLQVRELVRIRIRRSRRVQGGMIYLEGKAGLLKEPGDAADAD